MKEVYPSLKMSTSICILLHSSMKSAPLFKTTTGLLNPVCSTELHGKLSSPVLGISLQRNTDIAKDGVKF